MGGLKKFFFEHGEKVFFGLVAVWAIWSIGGDYFRAKNRLDVAGGTTIEIAPEQLRSTNQRINAHILNTEEAVMPALPEPFRSSSIVLKIQGVYNETMWSSNGWDTFYMRPPLRGDNVKIGVGPVSPPYPPEKYHPCIFPAENVAVMAGGRRVVVTFSDHPDMRHLKNVRATVWRTLVGFGKAGADSQKLAQAQAALSGVEVSTPADTTQKYHAGTDSMGMNPMGVDPMGMDPMGMDPMGMDPMEARSRGFDPTLGKRRSVPAATQNVLTPKNTEEDELAEDAGPVGGVDALFKKNREEWLKLDNGRFRALEEVLDPLTVPKKSDWTLIKADIVGTTNPLELDMLLAGKEPEVIPDATSEDDANAIAAYQPKNYYVIDQKIEENAIYRYRVVLSGIPLDLPEDVRQPDPDSVSKKMKYSDYVPFLREERYRLALTDAEFTQQVKASDAAIQSAKPDARMREIFWSLKMPSLQHMTGLTADEEPIRWWDLPEKHPARRNADLRKKLAKSRGYSDFVFSDYVLTPVRTMISFSSAFSADTVSIEVTLIDDQGQKRQTNILINRPVPTDMINYKLPPLQRYAEVTPVPIGTPEMKDKRSNTYFDFRTGWGVVDIRSCTILKTYLKPIWKTDPGNRPVLDKEGQKILLRTERGMTVEYKEQPYVILCEMEMTADGMKKKDNPRYRPLHQATTVKDMNNPDYEIQVKW